MHDLERFIDGFQRFQQQYFVENPGLYSDLRQGQHPSTLLIGCADSRVDPAQLLGCDPGDIFTVRNVANLVPPCTTGARFQGTSSAIQFAVQSLKVARIIVLGHAQCGGIRALVERDENAPSPDDTPNDFVGRWVRIAEPARRRIMQQMPNAPRSAQRRACELAAILVSMRNLETFPWVRERMEAGELTIHGWYFDLEAGALLAYSPRSDAFLPLVCPLDGQAPAAGAAVHADDLADASGASA